MRIFLTIIKRDLNLSLSLRSGLLNMLGFFLIICTLFPLGLGPQKDLLQQVAPAIILIAILLTTTLSLPSVFDQDKEDGCLDQYFLLPILSSQLFLAKAISNWLSCALPLLLLTPLAMLFFNVSYDVFIKLIPVLFLSSLTVTLIGVMGAALAIGSRKNTMLVSVICLPLYIPVFIFACGALNKFNLEMNLMFLLLIFAIALPVSVLSGSNALKNLSEN